MPCPTLNLSFVPLPHRLVFVPLGLRFGIEFAVGQLILVRELTPADTKLLCDGCESRNDRHRVAVSNADRASIDVHIARIEGISASEPVIAALDEHGASAEEKVVSSTFVEL